MSRNFNTPKDLSKYLEFFAREAIRAQPKNILNFNKLFLEEIEKNSDGNSINTIMENPEVYQKFRDNLLQRVGADEAELSSTNDEDLENAKVVEAATKIQANVRGFLVRKAAERRKESLQF
ncbi:unnamed protein product [Auanema sp. JU1783]|nr:unnamed protein product [Auanema sp. JU1783]